MTQAWYQVASMGFGYLSAAIIALIVLLALRKYMCDRALWRRVKKNLPQAGAAGTFRGATAVGTEVRNASEFFAVFREVVFHSHVHFNVRINCS